MHTNGTTPHALNDAPTRPAPTDNTAGYTPIPSVAETAPAKHQEVDLIARLRDKWGNRLPWFYAYSVPTVDLRPLSETPLADAVEIIAEKFPLRAGKLHHFYDHKLLNALDRLSRVRRTAEAGLLDACERAERSHVEADGQTAAATGEDHAALAELELRLAEAHRDAAQKVALIGGTYDPASPSDACVLRHERQGLERLAAVHALPWTPADKTAGLNAVVSWTCTLLVGAMIGTSIGIMIKGLVANNLMDRPDALVLFLLVGMAAAILGKTALFLSAREPSQRYWLGRPVMSWGPFAVFALFLMTLLLYMDSKVEQEGLLAGIRLSAMTAELKSPTSLANAAKEWAYFFCAMIVTLGYVVTSAWNGYLHGRYDACWNRLLRHQAETFQADDAARRAEPRVQEALDALARVRELLEREGFLLRRIAAVTASWDTKRLALPSGLDMDTLKLIQDARDNFEGAQGEFDKMLEEAMDDCEPRGGLLRRLGRAFLGSRSSGRTTRQPKRRKGK